MTAGVILPELCMASRSQVVLNYIVCGRLTEGCGGGVNSVYSSTVVVAGYFLEIQLLCGPLIM